MRFFDSNNQSISIDGALESFAQAGVIFFREASLIDLQSFLSTWTSPYFHPHETQPGLTIIEPRGTVGRGEDGFSRKNLTLHTDRAVAKAPPTIVSLLVLSSPDSGGETILMDGAKLFDQATKADLCGPESKLILQSELNQSFHVFEMLGGGKFVKIRYRFDVIAQPMALDQAARTILAKIEGLAYAKNLSFSIGEGYVLHNHRYLHGRNSFNGKRSIARLLSTVNPDSHISWMNLGFKTQGEYRD
ncbi:TauD/TfdA family dioxygenase [Nocardiopsis flavescens]|uniref:TauD/TfdA family dioxygenase n=1 Tax=Nocardiopsis flavescens TaxID=758803 RepID=UPI0036637B21